MKLLCGICIASAIATLLTGCNGGPEDKFVAKPPETIPAAAVTPGNEASLFPLDKGNQWTYSVGLVTMTNGVRQPQQSYESVWTVKDSKKTSDGVDATIESTVPNKGNRIQKWRTSSKGVYELADGTPPVAYNPPFPIIVFPATPESIYKWKGTGPNGTKSPGDQTSVRTIRASQVVDTDMGQMSAIPIDDSGTLTVAGKKGISTSTVWLAPGVGIVRFRQEVLVGNQGYVLLLKLKSKSLMKS